MRLRASVAAFAYCRCANDSGEVLAKEVPFEVHEGFDGTCDFGDVSKPACDVDFDKCQ